MPSVKYSSESESSDSDDDNLAQLREAVDTDLINDKMFELAGKKSQEEAVDTKPVIVQKSQRFIEDDNAHIDDLLIPEEVQKFVSKKLTKIIESRVEFVDVCVDHKGNTKEEHQTKQEEIKLLNDVVLNIDWNHCDREHHSKRKKPEIRKRTISDIDNCKTESMRLKEALIDVEYFPTEVSNWMSRTKGTLFEYREKNGKLIEVERQTEFSEKRKKNNWDESKISRNKNIF